MRKVRVGVIGVGWWGTVGHLVPHSEDPLVDLVAVYSRTEEKAKDRAEKFSVPNYYTDYKAMIDECELDMVSIATTPNVHYEQAKYALEHGVSVLMEKPFVLKASDAEDLAETAERTGAHLSVCHPMLFNDLMPAMREHVDAGELGNILLAEAHFSQRCYELYKGTRQDIPKEYARRLPPDSPHLYARPNQTSYSDPTIAGGGQGYTQTSHILGTLLWLTRLRPESVFAFMNNLDAEVDVVNAFTVRFTNGALANVNSNGLMARGCFAYGVELQGDQGQMIFNTLAGTAVMRREGERETIDIGFDKLHARPHPESLSGVTRNFVRTVLGEESLYVPTQIAIDEARILDAAYRSARSGKAESVLQS